MKKEISDMKDLRYLSSPEFLKYSFLALQNCFTSQNEFNAFFNAIINDDQKNLFLKTATFYLFLVKKGDWLVDVPGSNKRIDYFADTYKYIALFSLVESLHNLKFMDFYTYLIRRKSKVKFPIQDKAELNQYYKNYKKEFGSIQQSIRFFQSLSRQRKATLIQKLEVTNIEPTIENLSKYLYELRSKFVHEADLIVNMSGRTTISSREKNQVVICNLSIEDLMRFFEEGLVEHFKTKTT